MPRPKRHPEGEHRYNVRFALDLWALLQEAAKAESRSVNEQVEWMLREAFARRATRKRPGQR